MDVSGVDIFTWVLAFLLFVGLVYCLANLWDGADPFIAGILALACAAICFILTMSALRDAQHRAQDTQARHDFAVAGYSFMSADRLHVTLPIGECAPVLDVRKISGVYRPVLPGYKNGRKYWAVVTPVWQKKTSCPA